MEDREIIELYFQRDERAITETDSKYADYCGTIANNILLNQQDAEECVNDTWLRAWNAMPPQRPGILRQFLAKITRNLSFDRYRATHAEKRGGSHLTVVLEELKDCVPGDGDPATQVELEELKAEMGRFLRRLPERERGIFLRRYFYGEEMSWIAQRYGLKETNVRLILSRTRKKLKEHLRKEGLVA